jgi:hypothetical protein
MFDFFGSDKNQEKRKELEENIAQIREKVQNEERQRRAASGNDFREAPQEPQQQAGQQEQRQPPQRPEQDGSPGGSQQPQQRSQRPDEQRQEEPQMDEPQRRRQGQSDESDQRQQRQQPEDGDWEPEPPERLSQDQDGTDTQPQQPTPATRQQRQQPEDQQDRPRPPQPQAARNRAQETAQEQQEMATQDMDESAADTDTDSRMSVDDVPQPPEVKDLDIPEIRKGPLFITVDKFKNALTTLAEMQELVTELDSSIGSLENTLEEDRGTEEKLRDILDTTISGTEVIQDTVTPEPDEE